MNARDETTKREAYAATQDEIRTAAARVTNEILLYDTAVEALHRLPWFDWTGVYILAEEETLILGPFRGAPTDHVRIPVGRGICGQSAARDETVLVEDVTQEANYLACSLQTRSEIVVPIRVRGMFHAQIDVDSHTVSAFDEIDREMLEETARLLGERLESLG